MKGIKKPEDNVEKGQNKKGLASLERQTDVAVIGMACRLPGAKDYEEFWENLKQGRSSIGEIPQERWDWNAYLGDPHSEKNKTNSKWGGFIQDIDAFDVGFFCYSTSEVELMDPQQRIMLELSWTCFEDAGICPPRLSGHKVGVFVGTANLDYKELLESSYYPIDSYYATGIAHSVIASRISHYFNFTGPSLSIDTACSGSLYAIHLAIQSLQQEECSMALAAGVSILLTPFRYICFANMGILSPTGCCRTFDDHADGTVRGEGAGVVLLKPLKKALEDKDKIYGIIKGSAINHSGKTFTLSYPNPDAQAEVIIKAHKRAGILPEDISYIELHGTGTPKGDPIEFNGLLKAFAPVSLKTRRKIRLPYCGLGTAKPNIGHLESASGIVGVIKVLLSMKHKLLPPLQQFERLNHRISLEGSPFYIVDKLKEWTPGEGKNRECMPRRAGVSAFGFAGTNAHVIIEEAPPDTRVPNKQFPSYLICLSAKTEDVLHRMEANLALWLDTRGSDANIADICANLLLARVHFDIRAAYVVRDIQELKDKLKAVKDNEQPDGYYGSSGAGWRKQPQPLFEEFGRVLLKELSMGIELTMEECHNRLTALAELYVRGFDFDWGIMYEHEKAVRISLPTYPFEKDRYWVPQLEYGGNIVKKTAKTIVWIHPLLHQNTSDFSEHRFSSTFTGQEFFLSDYVVKGQRVLPWVVCLEMARAAVEQAAGVFKEGQTRIQLENLVWATPVAVGEQPIRVNIGLFPEDNCKIAYEIYYEPQNANSEPVVHHQGEAVISPVAENPTVDIKIMEVQYGLSCLTHAQCYEAFRAMGINYGPGYQGIEKIYVGKDQVLAKLCLPSSVMDTGEQFILHPSLMDSALQASLGLILGGDGQFFAGRNTRLELSLPFVLEEVEILRSPASQMWAVVRYSDNEKEGENQRKLDIDICDNQGNVCVRIKRLSSIAEGQVSISEHVSTIGTLLMRPCWNEQSDVQASAAKDYKRHLLMLCEPDEAIQANIQTQMDDGVRCITLKSNHEDIDKRFQSYTVQVFEEIQGALKDKSQGKVLIQIAVFNQSEWKLVSGISGMLRTARLEIPKLVTQVIEMDTADDLQGIVARLKESSSWPDDIHVRYHNNKRFVAGWSEVDFQDTASKCWKDGGVYLITGGAGGLGFIFAKEIAQKVKDAIVIITGRTALSEEKQAKLKELQALPLGTRIEYRRIDVTQRDQVADLVQNIWENLGGINGIIHSAGIIRDNYIIKKTVHELEEVMAPKVRGLVNLDQATKDLPLDFFILFSSGAGVMGNIGQADYAAANAFMDNYAGYRNELAASGQRHGHTLSINWPLWQEGGMSVDTETERMMRQNIGFVPMHTDAGIEALYLALASGQTQVLVAAGDLAQMREKLLMTPRPVSAKQFQTSRFDSGLLREKTLHQLKLLFGEITKLSTSKIDAQQNLENYGINSIMITQLNHKLAKHFENLSKTLFYEYQTLGALADCLIAEYPESCLQWTGIQNQQPSGTVSNASGNVLAEFENISAVLPFEGRIPVLTSLKTVRKSAWSSTFVTPDDRKQEPIAVIGMSGRYPGAKSLNEYWENLKQGQNCITEIPEDRWPLNGFYDPDYQKAAAHGKSYSKWGGFIEGFKDFDPIFFNISPREAESMDPQERLFMEECWKALEDAGYVSSNLSPELRQRMGVFGGITKQGFNLYGLGTTRHFSSTSFSSLVNRVSYCLDLQGPSVPIDTMCSSALVAIHEACEYLRQKRGDMVLAGAVNLYLYPSTYIALSMNQLLSDTPLSNAFGKAGKGFVPGEGVGVVVLKPYNQAVKDRDSIYAVIRGTAVNHSGKTNRYTTPSPSRQAAVILQALKENNIDPRTISYIEAAASGSEMADAIEMTALTKAFGERDGARGHYRIGSVKPNIGHCEAASGMAQLTKVILSLNHKTLVPTPIKGDLNPNINFEQLPFQLQRVLSEWERVTVDGHEVPRRAGITSIGAGGVNAHIIVEEYIPEKVVPKVNHRTKPIVFILSAKNMESLQEYVRLWIAYLKENQIPDLDNLAYTLQIGREEMPCRLAIVISSQEELTHQLVQWLEQQENTDCCYFSNLKNNKIVIQVGVAQALEARNMQELAKLWVVGNSVPWRDLHEGKNYFRVCKLPTYPFKKRQCWINHNLNNKNGEKHAVMSQHEYENKAAEFYTFVASDRPKQFQEDYLTFCPFEEKIPGFSMSRVLMNPDQYPFEADFMKAKQIEMRQVLFCKEDFNQINALFDFGCGHGTDVIQIASLYPHIKAHGFTITNAQAELGKQRIAQMKLGSRARIFHKDSARDAFPGCYDLIIGIEVSFHMRNKDGLFNNISASLNEGGRVLLMDYIANLRGPIVDPNIEISIPTRKGWINILSAHNLVIDEIIDVSPQVANFLYDPEFEENIKDFPEVAKNTLRNYANQSISLERGWISYCLLKLKKDAKSFESKLRNINACKIGNKIPYSEALKEMLSRGHIPYPKSIERR